MRQSLVKVPFLVAVVSFVSACGSMTDQLASSPLALRDVETQMSDPGPLLAFIASAKAIQQSDSHQGDIPAGLFIDLLPLSPADDQRLGRAFPGSIAVSCRGEVCSAETTGQPIDVTLQASVRIIFVITNPTLNVASRIATDFILRGDQGVEFCRTRGLTVSSGRLTRTLYGLTDQVESGAPKLAVSDASGDLSCAPR